MQVKPAVQKGAFRFLIQHPQEEQGVLNFVHRNDQLEFSKCKSVKIIIIFFFKKKHTEIKQMQGLQAQNGIVGFGIIYTGKNCAN